MYKRLVVGIDRAKMRLFDVDQIMEGSSEKEEQYEYTESKLNKSFDGFTF